jgi:hypothetical protein
MQNTKNEIVSGFMSHCTNLTDETYLDVVKHFLYKTSNIKELQENEAQNVFEDFKTRFLSGVETWVSHLNSPRIDKIVCLHFITKVENKERVICVSFKIQEVYTENKKIVPLNF